METIKAVRYQRGEMTPMKRVAYAALVFLAGILFPILIWVALVVVIREPLLRAIGRLALAWRQVATTRRAIRPVAYASLLFLVAILMPVLIWVAFAVVARELWLRWRESRLPSTLITANPPPRFVWVEGRYMPQY